MPDEPTTPKPEAPMKTDLAGYPTTEALVAGYHASGDEAKRLRGELDRAKELLVQFATEGSSPRQAVPDRRPSPQDRLQEFGLPVDALEQMIDARADRKVEALLKPLSQMATARQKIVSKYPDYVQFEHEVARFIETDADLATSYPKMFEADPVGAAEYALLKFTDSRRRAGGPPSGEIANGKVDAGIPTSRAGEGRRAPTGDATIQEAFERFQKTGSSRDAQAYAKARLGPVLTEQFRQQGQAL